MLLLVGGSISLATTVISSLAGKLPVADCSHSCKLLAVACLHLQPIWKGIGLPSAPDVVGRGKPDIDDLVSFVAVLVDHLVDGGVPVQGLVLLNIAGVSRGIPQISIGNLRSHCEVRSCPIKPDGRNLRKKKSDHFCMAFAKRESLLFVY